MVNSRIRITLVVVLVVLLAIFILENIEVVTVRFLTLEIAVSRAILIVVTVLIGFLIGYTTALLTRKRRVK